MSEIERAVQLLRSGGLVAFPTETVYGLGADATNAAAVRRIFHAKGRPSTNPIIVHVSDEKTARRYAGEWPENASLLAKKFWPGPLTLVVRTSSEIVPEVSAGRDTVGLRAPDHPLAIDLLRSFNRPIAAPSANRSTRISPTTADHVRQELADRVDLILDGGPCHVGIESTVLDLSGQTPTILRPGAITSSQIELLIGPVSEFKGSVDPEKSAISPGQHAVHYAPHVPTYHFSREQWPTVLRKIAAQGGRVHVLSIGQLVASGDVAKVVIQEMPTSSKEYSRRLYASLRGADSSSNTAIYIELPPDSAEWSAARDRINRASKPLR